MTAKEHQMTKGTKNAAKISKATKGSKKAKGTSKPSKAVATAPKGQNRPELKTNPFREGGGYWSAVVALRALGIGKMHSFSLVLPAIRKAMGNGWKEFASKKGKLTADQRAMLNVMVVSREDYGAPLKELGFEVRWDGREKQAGIFKVSK